MGGREGGEVKGGGPGVHLMHLGYGGGVRVESDGAQTK